MFSHLSKGLEHFKSKRIAAQPDGHDRLHTILSQRQMTDFFAKAVHTTQPLIPPQSTTFKAGQTC